MINNFGKLRRLVIRRNRRHRIADIVRIVFIGSILAFGLYGMAVNWLSHGSIAPRWTNVPVKGGER